MSESDTRRLRIEQVQRELAERKQADQAEEPADSHAHERRADKHAYLRAKLRERAEAEADDRPGG